MKSREDIRTAIKNMTKILDEAKTEKVICEAKGALFAWNWVLRK